MRHTFRYISIVLFIAMGLMSHAMSQELVWTISADGTIAGSSFSIPTETFSLDASGGVNTINILSSIEINITTTSTTFDVAVVISGQTLEGGSLCMLNASKLVPIVKTSTTWTANGTITGTTTCNSFSDGSQISYPSDSITYDASAPAPAASQLIPVTIQSSTGSVVITRDGTDSLLTNGNTTLSEGDVIQTGSTGSLEIVLGDGSRIVIRENTKFTVGDLVDPDRDIVSMAYGFIDWFVNRRMRIRTPAAFAAVRGTDLSVEHVVRGGLGTSTIMVDNGIVDVTDNDGVLTTLQAGEQISVNGLEALTGTEADDEPARYVDGVITIPALQVGNEFFRLTLILSNLDPIEFQLGPFEALSSSSSSSVSVFSGNILSIPEVTVESQSYSVDLLFLGGDPLTLRLVDAVQL